MAITLNRLMKIVRVCQPSASKKNKTNPLMAITLHLLKSTVNVCMPLYATKNKNNNVKK